MSVLATEAAPAKINLCLWLGPRRPDGRHELVTLFDSISLFDELEVSGGRTDEVVCAAVAGPNLVSDALSALRAAGWNAPPVTVRIRKRIPVAAGMGGGSADAAAMLRLAPRLAAIPGEAVTGIAAGLGSDVRSQLRPGPSIGTGAGEVVEPLADLPTYGVLVLPQAFALSTADVYREADRLGMPRPADELASLRAELAAALPESLPTHLIGTDLQAPAMSLAPRIAHALSVASGAGADHVLVCGSGPTVIGIYHGPEGLARASAAADQLPGACGRPLAAGPVGRGVASSAANQ